MLFFEKLKTSLKTIPTKVRRTFQTLKKHVTRKRAAATGIALFCAVILLYVVSLFVPRTVAFAFVGNNCVVSPALLPNFVKSRSANSYTASPQPSLRLAGYPVYAHRTCITPLKAPQANTYESIPYGGTFAKKSIKITVDALPALQDTSLLDRPLSVQDPMEIIMGSGDAVFDYQLVADTKTLACQKMGTVVWCDIPELGLAQSKKYVFKLQRLFDGQPADTVFEQEFTTVENVHIKKSSISPGKTIYDKPKNLILTLNRPTEHYEDMKLETIRGDKRESLGVKPELKENKLVVTFDKPLPRDMTLELSVQSIRAADGGFMAKPYKLRFKTSGGPKVTGANTGTYKASGSGPYVLSFDSAVSTKQNLSDYVQIVAGGKVLGARVSVQGNHIIVTPTSILGRCVSFSLRVKDGLQNAHGISGGSAWNLNSRTLCQNVFSIGTSVQGRGITAYSFGTGASTILFVGATHGDETSSANILRQLIDYLESRGGVPAGKTVTIIPVLNPDGYAANQRTNARNVDLNRNFPANNWKRSVIMPGGARNTNGGGKKPLSEPESAALANFVLNHRPKLVLTYHAVAGLVIPNGSGNSSTLARLYDRQSNVGYSAGSENESVFQYDTTGAFEDWLHDKAGIPALLIELWTRNGYEFNSHRDAMWSMIAN